ncbi:MAG: hypothetical protein HY892_20680 [Deltaproteobacteria bacterium]|nr:hypothetical protein [Deltaproteobacteria bacterium]
MDNQKEKPKAFSTCLEDVPFAEIMRKMSGKQGPGSLCMEMMRKVREKSGGGGPCDCAETMQSMMKKCTGMKGEPGSIREEEDHVGEK